MKSSSLRRENIAVCKYSNVLTGTLYQGYRYYGNMRYLLSILSNSPDLFAYTSRYANFRIKSVQVQVVPSSILKSDSSTKGDISPITFGAFCYDPSDSIPLPQRPTDITPSMLTNKPTSLYSKGAFNVSLKIPYLPPLPCRNLNLVGTKEKYGTLTFAYSYPVMADFTIDPVYAYENYTFFVEFMDPSTQIFPE